ncbi:ATP-dependent DNA helicase DinG [Paenibacillus thermoaerophilus]|uniref:3'-5' exonuclease DinG n=1 Tax=Paenibacillus thermoaerophilus TaxID=1215385 RepID=A0ABW2V2V9_9BACL|nr:ATP-dependent DNA helicase DinG [Paenibacillus thermoaerophilus]TMV18671.1 ATP-dependent DNA helicase DinG [Paenibacillus thermoaerophilus]
MKYAVLDFETTGDQADDRVIQVGLVLVDGHEIVDRYTSFVQPERSIPASISQLTGITDEDVADAPTADLVMAEILPLLNGRILVGHNVGFDLKFLQRTLTDNGYFPFQGRCLDTLEALRILFPSLTSLALSMASSQLGVPHERPHHADSDADATARLWIKCLEKLNELPLVTVQRLAFLYEGERSDWAWFLQQIASEREMEAARGHAEAEPSAGQIYRNFALKAMPWDASGDEEEANADELRETLGDDFSAFYDRFRDRLREKFEAFEERESQNIMAKSVHEAFRNGKHLLVEAGTGTGKSLGYLIPSLYYALREQVKVVVSTHTINLQEQLRQRDLPLLREHFPVPFRAAVLKGRSRYLCLRKFEERMNAGDVSDHEERLTAAQMIVWLGETEHGDEEELHLQPKGRTLWRSVASDADSCLNRACPWFRNCFYHRARHDAQEADLIITNHSLLFTDVQAEHRILPAYKHLVVDEAHHFEAVASEHLGHSVSYTGLTGSLLWLYKDARTGQLPVLRHRLESSGDESAGMWIPLAERAMNKLVDAKEQWDALSERLYEVLASQAGDPLAGESGGYVFRLKPQELPPLWDEVSQTAETVLSRLKEATAELERLAAELKEEQERLGLASVLTDLSGAVKDVARHRDELAFLLSMKDEHFVYWLEGNPNYRSKSVVWSAAPVDVSSLLRKLVFEVKDSVVLTSATLSVGRTFQFACDQLGLRTDADEVLTLQLPSPFQYRRQSLVVIPRDFPKIKGAIGDPVFQEMLVQSLAEIAVATEGRMLVLFTSNRMLRQTHAELKERLAPHNITVLGQGVDSGSRSKLTRLFQSQQRCVLLGTNSFWEGVDIPGDALSCLAIVRLPFQPPNHPVVEAKAEMLKKRNQNPFMAWSVPQAVIRFKQGFGRLIRTASDRGIVVLYDTRVLDTYYGKHFLYSLPGPKIEHMRLEQMVPRIEEWLKGEEQQP